MKRTEIQKLTVGYMETNCYLLVNDISKETVILDPGDQPRMIADAIAKGSLKPVAVLLTHGHFDHILAVEILRRYYQIPVYAHEEEKEVLNSSDYNLTAAFGEPIEIEADKYVLDKEILELAGFSIQVMLTPGHTKGSVCYYLKEEGILFSGDTLFYHSVGRTDFPTGSMSQLRQSIAVKVLDLPDETTVYPGHGEQTIIGIEKNNDIIW